MSTLTEQQTLETKNKATITSFINTTIPNTAVPAFSTYYVFIGGPPPVCSDGIRRPNILDYIDFLFQDPTIDSLLKTRMGTAGTATVSTTMSGSGQLVVNVINSVVATVPRIVVSSGGTLPVTLTKVSQTTTSTGTTFADASTITTNSLAWDACFSSAMSVSTGYCSITATPVMTNQTSISYQGIIVGLSTTAMTPDTSTVFTPTTNNIYGFLVWKRSNGVIELYAVLPTAQWNTVGYLTTRLVSGTYATMPTLMVSYSGTVVKYSVNGAAATLVGGGTTDQALSTATIYASGIFSKPPQSGTTNHSLTNVTWGSVVPGPKGADGKDSTVQGIQGIQGPVGPGFTAITPTTANCVLTANGTTTTATSLPNVLYTPTAIGAAAVGNLPALTPAATLVAPNMSSSTGAIIAPINSTIAGTAATGFSSYSAASVSLIGGTAKVVLSGLRASGLYICSAAANNITGTAYHKLAQFYIRKSGIINSGTYSVDPVGAVVPAGGNLTWSVTVVSQVGTTPASFSLILTSVSNIPVAIGITLLANTPNFF